MALHPVFDRLAHPPVRPPAEAPLKRARYRIEYPSSGRPSFVVGEARYEVLDCSETGLRFAWPTGQPLPDVGTVMVGLVRFGDRREAEVGGVVARIIDRSVALHFRGEPIPFSLIMAEQHYLRRHFLGHLVDPS